MSDISMERIDRLRKKLGYLSDADSRDIYIALEELIRLRGLIGCDENQSAMLLRGSHETARIQIEIPLDDYIHCRALLDAEKGEHGQ